MTRCPGTRLAHLTASAAAWPVILVKARSHGLGPYCPSAWCPCWALNAARIFARAAVCWASACSSPISASACADVPKLTASQAVRYPSPARTMASACTVLDGTAGSVWVHIGWITSPQDGRLTSRNQFDF